MGNKAQSRLLPEKHSTNHLCFYPKSRWANQSSIICLCLVYANKKQLNRINNQWQGYNKWGA